MEKIFKIQQYSTSKCYLSVKREKRGKIRERLPGAI